MEIYRSIYKYQLKCFSSLTHFLLSCRRHCRVPDGMCFVFLLSSVMAVFEIVMNFLQMWWDWFPSTSTEKVDGKMDNQMFCFNYCRWKQTYYSVLSAFPPYKGQLCFVYFFYFFCSWRNMRNACYLDLSSSSLLFHSIFMHILMCPSTFLEFQCFDPFILSFFF